MKIAVIILSALAVLAVVGILLFVYVVQNVETPVYTVVAQDGAFELRDYPSMVVAEVRREGSRQKGLSAGFGPLARYIFAKERGGEKIAMTAPVEQQAAPERIAMTAPVEQQAVTAPGDQAKAQVADGTWAVRFIIPQGHPLADLPAPASADVQLREVPARRLAVVRFSGRTNDAMIRKQEQALTAWLAGRGLVAAGAPIYAYYNDPFTPGPLRRNEVQVELAPTGD